jgi:hypothetical protein
MFDYIEDRKVAEKLISNQTTILSFKEAFEKFNFIPIDLEPVFIDLKQKTLF